MLPSSKLFKPLPSSLLPVSTTTTTTTTNAVSVQPPQDTHSKWTHQLLSLLSPPSPNPTAALRLLHHHLPPSYTPPLSALSSLILSLCSLSRFAEAHHRLLLLLPSHPSLLSNPLLSRLLDSPSTPHLTLHLLHHLPCFVPSLTNYNRLICNFCSMSQLSIARTVLSTMHTKGVLPNVVSYTTLMSGYVKNGQLDDARKVFGEMCLRGVKPNSLSLSVLIRGVFRKRRLEEGRELMVRMWARMGEDGVKVRSRAFANVVDSLCREGLVGEVFRIAEEMPQGKWVREEFAYGEMIDSLCRVGRCHGASRIVYIMRRRGFVPSFVSYNSIVHGLSKGKGCMRAYQLFKEGVVGFGYSLPESTYKVLIEGLCKERDLNKAKDVVEFMIGNSGVDKTRIYNIFLSALRLVDNPTEQLNVLILMLQKQCPPDVITLNTVIHGFCKLRKVTEASQILKDMLEGKFCAPDVVTFTTVIRGLIDAGKLEEALDLLKKTMPECVCPPNIVTYNVVLSGLFKLKKTDDAMEMFVVMTKKGVPADSTTYTIIIEGLFESGRLEEAKQFWDDVVWPSKTHDDYVYAAILGGLCQSGKLDVACDFLYELVDSEVGPGIVNYNILVDAACKLGLKKEAYQIVGEMRKNGLKPDAVTWRILGKLHVGGHQCLQTERIIDEKPAVPEILENKFEKITYDNDKESNSDTENQEDPLDGLVDPCFSHEVVETYKINEGPFSASKADPDANVGGKGPLKQCQDEPLSRTARRVFGLL